MKIIFINFFFRILQKHRGLVFFNNFLSNFENCHNFDKNHPMLNRDNILFGFVFVSSKNKGRRRRGSPRQLYIF